jgi:hypothetical protein
VARIPYTPLNLGDTARGLAQEQVEIEEGSRKYRARKQRESEAASREAESRATIASLEAANRRMEASVLPGPPTGGVAADPAPYALYEPPEGEPPLDSRLRNMSSLGQPKLLTEEEAGEDVFVGGPADGVGGPPGLTEADIVELRGYRERKAASADQAKTRALLLEPVNPDQAAEDEDLARRAGVQPVQVEQDREGYRAAERAKELDALAFRAPKVKSWISDQNNFRIAHDDVENLEWWETVGAVLAGSPGAFEAGTKDVGGMGWGLGRALNDLDRWVSGKLFGTSPDDINFRLAESLAEAKQRQAMAAAEESFPDVSDPTARGILSGVRSIPLSASAAGASVVTGGVAPGLLLAGTAVGGGKYGEARAQGLDVATSAAFGAGHGGIEALTELIPMKWLVGDIVAKTPLVQTLAKQFLAEIPGEQVATATQDFLDWAVLPENADKTFNDYLAARPAAAYETLLATVVGTGVQTTVIKAANDATIAAGNAMQQRRSEDLSRTFDAMAKGAKDSNLLRRLPDKYREAVASVTKDGPLESVRIQPEALVELAQSNNLTPEQLAQAFRIDPVELAKSISSGEDVVIPAGNYAAALGTANKELGISGEAIHTALAPNMRLRADDFTAKEHEAMQAVFEEEQKARTETGTKEQGFADSADRVREAIREQVAGVKLFNTETANTQAAIAGEMVVTLAERTGRDPEKLWNEMGFDVVASISGDPDAEVLAQLKPPTADETMRAEAELSFAELATWKHMKADNPPRKELAKRLTAELGKPVTDVQVGNYLASVRRKGFDLAKRTPGTKKNDETLKIIELRARRVRPAEIAARVFPDRDPQDAIWSVYQAGRVYKQQIAELQAKYDAEAPAREQPQEKAGEPRFYVDYDPRDLILMFNDGMTDAEMAAELSLGFDKDIEAGTLSVQMSRVRATLKEVRDDPERYQRMAEAMAVTVDQLDMFIDNSGKRRQTGLLTEARRIYDTGATESSAIVERLQRWASNNLKDSEQPTLETLRVTASKVRAERAEKVLTQGDMRGSFSPRADRSVIRLFESSNLSTFVHEASHWYLDTLWRMAQTAEPHPFVQEQLAAILEWTGKSPNWTAMFSEGRITEEGRELHEAFAETFEAYLREGKAPSTGLRSVFATLKQWLLRVYKSLTQIGRRVNLNDEIRAVFDRALASDEAIKAAREGMERDGEAMAKALLDKGVITEKAFERTKARLASAKERAEADLMARLMEDYERNQKAWWQSEERQVRAEVATEVDERPEQRAFQWLSGGGWRSTQADVVEAAAAEAEAMALIQLAQADGYLGNNREDAREWIDARAKGLNMSVEVRESRAKEQGFTTKAFHETKAQPEALNEGFDLTRRHAAMGDAVMPLGVFTKPAAGGIGIGKTQVPLLLRLGNTRIFEDRAELEAHLRQDPEYAALADRVKAINDEYRAKTDAAEDIWHKMSRSDPDWLNQNDRVLAILKEWETAEAAAGEQARVRATALLKAEGLNSITVRKDTGSFTRAVKTTIVFDPKDIRSPDAAFDPDNTGSISLLAQSDGSQRLVSYVDTDATDASIQSLRDRMIADNRVPAILLFRTSDNRVIAFSGEEVNYSHDLARTMLGLGNLQLDHGVWNPRLWPTLAEMNAAGRTAWYGTSGAAKDKGEGSGALAQSSKPANENKPLKGKERRWLSREMSADDARSLVVAERSGLAAKEIAEETGISVEDVPIALSRAHEVFNLINPKKVMQLRQQGVIDEQIAREIGWGIRDGEPEDLRRALDVLERKARRAIGDLAQAGDGNQRTAPPPNLPPMRLDLSAVREQYGEDAIANLPPEVRAYATAATDADQFIQIARDVRRTLNQKRPKSLWKFLATRRVIGSGNDKIAYSGIRDEGGEVIGIIGAKNQARGLIADPAKDAKTARSYTIEQAAQAAWEEGYFSSESPPTPAEFLDALANDVQGIAPIYSRDDIADVQRIRDAEIWEQWFDAQGIDISAPVAEMRTKLEEALTSDVENAISPDEAAQFFKMPDGNALLQGIAQGPQRDAIIRELTRQRMIARHGDIFRDGTIAEEAAVFARNEVAIRQDEIELEALAKAAGKQFESNLAKQMAQENLRTKQVREVLNYNQWRLLEERWNRKAVEAALKGKEAEAFDYKRYALINRHMFLEGRKTAESIEKTRAYMRSLEGKAKRIKIAKAGQDYLDQIDQILDEYEFRKRTDKVIRERTSLAQWFAEKQAQADPLRDTSGMTPEEVMAARQEEIERSDALAAMQREAGIRNYKSLTVEELLAVRDQAQMIERLAHQSGSLLVESERRSLKLAIEDVVAGIVAAKPDVLPAESYASFSPKETGKRGRREYMAELRTLQSLIRQIDGVDNGPLAKHILHKLNSAFGERIGRMRQEEKNIVKLYQDAYGANLSALRKDPIRFPGVAVPLSKMERLTVALNMGTEINRKRLIDGYGWDQSTLQAIINTLDQKDWAFVRSVWDYVNSLYPEANEAHLAVHGVPLNKQPGIPIVTRFGIIDGQYFPLKYNPHQSSRAAQQDLMSEAKRITGQVGTRKASSFTKERAKGRVNMPVLLDFSVVLPQHVDEVVASITTQKALLDAGRIIVAKDVEQAIVERHGRIHYKQITNALREARNGPEIARTAAERALVRLRNGATIVGLGLNMTTALLQPGGHTNSLVRLGGKNLGATGGVPWLLKGIYRMGVGAQGLENGLKFIVDRSQYMQNRRESQNRELADRRRKIEHGKVRGATQSFIEESSLFFIKRVQYYFVDAPLWLGAYEKALSGGASEGDAVGSADQAVIDAQGGGEIYQLAGIQRGSPLLKLFTNFISYAVTTWNLAASRTAGTNFRNPGQAAAWALDMAVLMSAPVLLTMIVRGLMSPGGDDDDEPVQETFIRQQLAFLMSQMGLFGQLGSAISGYSYTGPQGTRAFSDASKAVDAAGKDVERLLKGEPMTGDAIRPLNLALGAWWHYPAAALDRFVRGADALAKGKTDDPKALLVGPPRE